MAENTRVPANTDAVDDAREVKNEHDDTWTEVMRFYADHRSGTDADADRQRLHQLLSDVGADPEEIADEVVSRFDYTELARMTRTEVVEALRE